jgi:purine-cytosine permease-like protein
MFFVYHTRIVLGLISTIVLNALIILTILLGNDIITIPYLTPIAHFLGYCLHPITYVLFPLYFAAFIKIYRYEHPENGRNWKGRWNWLFVLGVQFVVGVQSSNFMLRLYKHMSELYKWNRVNKMGGVGEFCGGLGMPDLSFPLGACW